MTAKRRSSILASGWTFAALVGFVLAVAAMYWWRLNSSRLDPAERGQFGDMFGGLNALFTALAFAALIYTVLLQRDELSLQRRELAGQRKQLREQNRTFRLQSFENTFFQLLALHHQIVGAITIDGSAGMHRGRDAFELYYAAIRTRYGKERGTGRRDATSLDELNTVDAIYLREYEKRQADFGHYFRNLYHTLKLVEGSVTAEDKRQYAGFVRAQLSTFELLCLFYNCLSQQGVQKFKPLAERYALFKNLPQHLLLHEQHIAFYAGTAFGYAEASGNDTAGDRSVAT